MTLPAVPARARITLYTSGGQLLGTGYYISALAPLTTANYLLHKEAAASAPDRLKIESLEAQIRVLGQANLLTLAATVANTSGPYLIQWADWPAYPRQTATRVGLPAQASDWVGLRLAGNPPPGAQPLTDVQALALLRGQPLPPDEGREPTGFDQRGQTVHGSQTNISGNVTGPVLSGIFRGPVVVGDGNTVTGDVALGDGLRNWDVPLVKGLAQNHAEEAARLREAPPHPEQLDNLRLDVAAPEQVVLQRAFVVAVAVRQAQSPALQAADLQKTASDALQVDWPANAPAIELRVTVQAPDCVIRGEPSATFRLRRGHASPVFRFMLVAQKLGPIALVVAVHQVNLCLGTTSVGTTVIPDHLAGEAHVSIQSTPLNRSLPMQRLTWLHLSDWHQKDPRKNRDFNRKVVLDALLKDIRGRARIDPALAPVDFVVFSGDLSQSGKLEEYQAARETLLDPVLNALDLKPDRLFIVPGNHDLSWDALELVPAGLAGPLTDDAQVQKWLGDDRRGYTLAPFKTFATFVNQYTGQVSPDFACVKRLEVDKGRVALLGLNSAWMCARVKDAKGEVDDKSRVLVGEPQIHDPLLGMTDADTVRIAVMHHPFEWMADFDRDHAESQLGQGCHFILRGHEHRPKVQVTAGTDGSCVVIPAGASYNRRLAENPRYTNAYNWVHLDLTARRGAVYLRRWSEPRNEWIKDEDTSPDGKFPLNALPKGLGG